MLKGLAITPPVIGRIGDEGLQDGLWMLRGIQALATAGAFFRPGYFLYGGISSLSINLWAVSFQDSPG